MPVLKQQGIVQAHAVAVGIDGISRSGIAESDHRGIARQPAHHDEDERRNEKNEEAGNRQSFHEIGDHWSRCAVEREATAKKVAPMPESFTRLLKT